MHDIHVALAWLSGAGVAIVVVIALLGDVRPIRRRTWLDRAIIGTELAIAAAAIAGLVRYVSGAGPSEPLHYVYAGLVSVALPAVRLIGPPGVRPRRAVVLVGGLVALGLLGRLAQTGGP